MRGTPLNERPQMETHHATLMERISDVFKLRGIAHDYLVDRAENRSEGLQLALQVSDRLRCFLDAFRKVVDFYACLECECCDAQ